MHFVLFVGTFKGELQVQTNRYCILENDSEIEQHVNVNI